MSLGRRNKGYKSLTNTNLQRAQPPQTVSEFLTTRDNLIMIGLELVKESTLDFLSLQLGQRQSPTGASSKLRQAENKSNHGT